MKSRDHRTKQKTYQVDVRCIGLKNIEINCSPKTLDVLLPHGWWMYWRDIKEHKEMCDQTGNKIPGMQREPEE